MTLLPHHTTGKYQGNRICLALPFFVFFLFLASCPVLGQYPTPSDGSPRLKTICDAPVEILIGKGVFQYIPARTIVVPSRTVMHGDTVYLWVSVPAVPISGKPLVGWMKEDYLERVRSKVETERRRAEKRKNLPLSCRVANREYIDKEYENILALFSRNRELKEEERLPEPCFARAELFTQLDNPPKALLDYLEGMKYVKNANESGTAFTYILYEKYFPRIDDAVVRSLVQPISVASLGRNERETAEHHFSQGYSEFWNGESTENIRNQTDCYKKALRYFDNAITVNWQSPTYWYYRGLTYWRLGNKRNASFDLLYASQLEQELKNHAEISKHLTRFQGKDRMFLEQIRWGDPSGLVIKEFFK